MNPVALIYLVGFGSIGIAWVLQHLGDAADSPTNTNEFRRYLAYALYGLGFLISLIGTGMALDAAQNPSQYGIIP